MCQHQCKCGKLWSHQDFPTLNSNGTSRYDPCPFPVLYDNRGLLLFTSTQLCPHCYEEKRRWTQIEFAQHKWDRVRESCTRCGIDLTEETKDTRCSLPSIDKLSFRKALDKMAKKEREGSLSPSRIIEIQLDEEGLFKLWAHHKNEEAMAEHYNNIQVLMESYRVRALTHARLRRDYDIEKLSHCTDEERAEFEEAKQRQAAKRKEPNVAAIRQSKQEKMIASFADKIMASNPSLSREDAITRATLMFG